MLRFKKVQTEAFAKAEVVCNKCAKVAQISDGAIVESDFITIRHTYQYGSVKDGDKYLSHVCEPCMDEFYATFKIPPQVAPMTEWGRETPDPIIVVDDSQKPDA
jgi:hypothetical protein